MTVTVIKHMRHLFSFLICLTSLVSFGKESPFEGTWQGVLFKAGTSIDQGSILYAEFRVNDGIVSGYMREETFGTENFGLKQITGKVEGNKLTFNQTVTEKNKTAYRSKWCLMKGELTYDSTTGYFSGDYQSTDCKRNIGKIVMYESDFELSKADSSHASHIWFERFVQDYKDGLSAPKIREIERKNFVFEPIYFDFDKSEIRDEHKEFLDRMIKVVKGHSDLRVLVTGHTDSDGSNAYNEGLSQRRAEAIVQYFKEHGLSEDHLKFDFKGETKPADTNNTPEGRQRNRRVDFKFI